MVATPILIVGAGPTGLNLALSLARAGTPFRIISEASGPGEQSRAMAVHARTLEFYRQFGFAEEVVEHGVVTEHVHLREAATDGASHEVATFSFTDLGEGISPYPFMLTYPQDDHERLLAKKLEAAGVKIEWSTKLTGFTQDAQQVRASMAGPGGQAETITCDYICGCDGAHSQVRQSLGVQFPGATYEQLFYVADARIDRGFDTDMYVNLGQHILALMLPVRSTGMQRLIGIVPPELSDRTDLTFEDIRGHIEPLIGVHVTEVNWFSTYRVHHRVAAHFHLGRAFLLGDAGHVHSPAGGQGMNTGIGDAINLGWKLAQVVAGRAGTSLLDTYEPERIGFARALVATTDRAFTQMVGEGLRGELFRRIVAPTAVAVMTRFALTRHAAFRTLSQTHIHYDKSPLSEGTAGHVHGGDRLPWTGAHGEDNFAPLGSCDWQIHIYGTPEPAFSKTCAEANLNVHAFDWTDAGQAAGLARNAAYLVRPDGYVALATTTQDAAAVQAFASKWGLAFAKSSGQALDPV